MNTNLYKFIIHVIYIIALFKQIITQIHNNYELVLVGLGIHTKT